MSMLICLPRLLVEDITKLDHDDTVSVRPMARAGRRRVFAVMLATRSAGPMSAAAYAARISHAPTLKTAKVDIRAPVATAQ